MLVFLLAGLAGAMGPVAKVIQLLDELSSKVQANSQQELAEFTEYSHWCDATRRDKEHAIGDSKRSIEDLTATVESSKAEIDQLRTKVEELSTAISQNEDDLGAAKSLRAEEQRQFETTDAELTETISTLVRAQDVLSKHTKQSTLVEVKANLEKVTASLTQIVEASWVNTDQKAEIQAFLQKDDNADEFSLDQQPQASTSAYDSHSNGILDTLSDLQGKAEQAQTVARKEEMQKQHAYKMLAQSIEGELKAQNTQLEDAKKNIAVNTEAQSEAEGDLQATQRTLAQDSKVLEELKAGCQEKAQEFEANTKGRAEELQALAKAKEILQGGVGTKSTEWSEDRAFVQSPAFVQVRALAQESAQMLEAKDAAVTYLERLGRKLNSIALTQDAVTMRADPFGKVKALIEDMVEKLLLEASNEADRKAWCDAEVGKTSTTQEEKQRKLDVADTHIEKAEATSAKLSEAVSELNRELAEMDASMSEATKLRQEEHQLFDKAVKDYSDGQEATASAITVLRKYYEGGSFLQGAKDNSGTANAIIGMLEVAEADFSRMEADARASEAAAQKTYDDTEREHQVTRAAKTAEMNAKSSEQKRLDNEAGDYKMDRQGVQKELDAVNQYSEKLKPECEVKAPTYEARAERRKQELEGLQNALEILEGKALAFVQTKVTKFLAH